MLAVLATILFFPLKSFSSNSLCGWLFSYLAQMGHICSNQWNDELDAQSIENISDAEDTRYFLEDIRELVKRMKDTEEKVDRKKVVVLLIYFISERSFVSFTGSAI
jgi:hypothetical protein